MASADVEFGCFVGGLAWVTNDQAPERAFSQYGKIIESKIISDRETGRSRGFGFVTFRDEQSMRDAIERMNGQDLDGRNITVKKVHTKRGGGGRGGGDCSGDGGSYGGGGSGYGRREGNSYGGSCSSTTEAADPNKKLGEHFNWKYCAELLYFEASTSKMGMEEACGTSEELMPPVEKDISADLDFKVKKYLRGEGANLEVLQDKKLKGQLAVREKLYGKSAKAAAKTEKWLMPSEEGYLEAEGLEKTWRIKQESIVREVDLLSSRKPFDMVLPDLGPYTLDYTSSGRYMAVAGRKGHLAIIDMKNMGLIKEFQVRETVRDIVFMHNELFFAAAQKKYPYIYSRDGTELHCLKEHGAAVKLKFLKNHFLLASINKFGQLHYQDVTMGEMVGNYRTGLGRCNIMEVNPFNAVVTLGHSCGKVTMWKPTSSAPLVKMLCHHGPISAIALHSGGNLMATAGMDKKIKLWDLRKFEVLHTYPGHAKTLDFSQKGLLAIGNGSLVQIWKDSSGAQAYSRYMSHSMIKGYQVGTVSFQPYEDVLGIGHSMGISSILIPGSGEPNFDTWVANPFENSKQRREKEVHSLLDKLPPETIMLDPTKIGTMRRARKKEKPTNQEREAEMEAAVASVKSITLKKKTKGRNKPSKQATKKQQGIVRAKRPFLEQQMREEQQKLKKQRISEDNQLPKSLQRFGRKQAT
ncbi:hypothetical protein NE237_009418 [Protea cynaroides]|uniref:RRM domain-containing protein n=1 Tax=Protea cynaroides TaxID=273540 RepID=A0A9Q0KXE4_9MAGN|nr:hypothetical protein NE237_009418 [Protea cynaroides]